ncbi:hypothetical protein CYMTET_47992 [Cymbomonas tetramitiformis]|uniref:protein-tyrosine-phosphatase n=1 Tax=Cymbomonas tetramitiformis TaxID=36881 RepID=A0AAE0BT60_9CHLO|nr:hypothetical protein CYMTET_47992 [Cymbomonas tetramitiformis]|eukprot:gene20900-25067_t
MLQEHLNGADQILPGIWLGGASASRDLDHLRAANIAYILNITETEPNHFEDQIKYLKVPVPDYDNTNLLVFFEVCCDFMASAGVQKKGVLVHCAAGVSRSCTALVAYLMKHYEWSLEDALAKVKAKRRVIKPNPGFLSQLEEWQQHLQNGSLPSTNPPPSAPVNMTETEGSIRRVQPWLERSKALYMLSNQPSTRHLVDTPVYDVNNGQLDLQGGDDHLILPSALDHVLGSGAPETLVTWLEDLIGEAAAHKLRKSVDVIALLRETMLSEAWWECWVGENKLEENCVRWTRACGEDAICAAAREVPPDKSSPSVQRLVELIDIPPLFSTKRIRVNE